MNFLLLHFTISILLLGVVNADRNEDLQEFYTLKDCEQKCIFPSQNLTSKTIESFPKSCSTVCTELEFNQQCDLTEEELTETFKNMKHLIGGLVVVNTKFKSGGFLAGLESIECYDTSITWVLNNKTTELGLLNLTSITCSGINMSSNMKHLKMPSLKNMESTNPNSSKLEIFIASPSFEFCLTIQEMRMFMEIEAADVDHIFAKYCKPELTEKLCKKPAEGCVEIYGNVEIGQSTDLENMKDVEMIYGSLTIKGTKLKDFQFLKKLKYVAQMEYKPAISVQDNPNLINITFPSLKRIRSETTELMVFKRNNASLVSDPGQCFGLRSSLRLSDWAPTFDYQSCEDIEITGPKQLAAGLSMFIVFIVALHVFGIGYLW